MAINRRQFLTLSAGLALATAVPLSAVGTTTAPTRLLSCRTDSSGQHFLSCVDLYGRLLMDIALPARGHGVAVDGKQQLAAVFSRRPGYYVLLVDLVSRQIVTTISPANGRHFYGHGVFSADGSRLLCSENAYDSGVGVIGIYQVKNGQRLGEFASHGIGPHEIKRLNHSDTLVVANGGIRTHPDLPRIKSNLADMRPNLAYVDIASGKLLHQHAPPEQWHQLSIRHIDVAADDTVAAAMQFQGNPYQQPPLIALQQGRAPLQFLQPPKAVQKRLRNYCGSVVFSADSSQFAVSSPRGSVVTYWAKNGEYLGLHEQRDVCGLAPDPQYAKGFIASDGTGQLRSQQGSGFTSQQTANSRWDNHMQMVSG